MSWVGNREVGVGTMTIVKSQSPNLIQIKLEFLKPFAANNTAEFTFVPTDSDTGVTGTKVTWRMHGKNNLFAKAVGLLLNYDKMVGDKFEEGLNNLQSLVRAGS